MSNLAREQLTLASRQTSRKRSVADRFAGNTIKASATATTQPMLSSSPADSRQRAAPKILNKSTASGPAAPTSLVVAVKEQLLASKHTITPLGTVTPRIHTNLPQASRGRNGPAATGIGTVPIKEQQLTTPLQAAQVAQALRHHPDTVFAQAVLQDPTEGVSLDYEGPAEHTNPEIFAQQARTPQ